MIEKKGLFDIVTIISMKIVVGLGNPEEKHDGTRHNVGFLVVDKLVKGEFKREKKFKSLVLKEGEVLFVKPETYMNRSGEAVQAIVNYYSTSVDDLYVIHDDLDIRLGDYKIQLGVGPKDHNGVNDVVEKLGNEDFWRVRIGVDGREERGVSGEEYVLQKFSPLERGRLEVVVDEVLRQLIDKLALSR